MKADEAEHLTQIHIFEELGATGVRAIMDALNE